MQSTDRANKYQAGANLTVVRKHCITCNKQITTGRANKRFCDDYCRSVYNNNLKADANNFVRNVKNALGKNRLILQTLLSENDVPAKVTRDILLQDGFQFKYHTHTQTNKRGHTYYYCYEYGYMDLGADQYLLVKEKNNII